MNPVELLLYCAWAAFHAVHLAFGVAALRQRPDETGRRRLAALVVSGAASVVPMATLLALLYDQMVGFRMAAWDWRIIQSMLLFVNAPASLVILVAACLPPYPPRHARSTASRIALVLAAGSALAVLAIATSGPMPPLF